ncbi:DEAD/DEAH box helicase [Roseivirga pacifica]|uniref:DEAD/DEAH box helicase n=1 Tax=Roseivirga pacifica TaxID=1267423 RepID=UPI0020956F70|nr:DEAD/DEAH box helicase [Roseivirga pacifica]MCO6360518.1 DEAD/DEAH box helicase [Roseivirga pacifica]MCO6368407.1 DEAD/DEAH box helicase [Roseivirga pacifica]MCO6372549.1 DEAD/DEAH box helicase [Roseivirga pacifica]MCO6376607.1 DEAD/DEAH box helicase [Roseivirga pacifica]MCO6378113.1 DEAD/DEAH box helicase [Roseivirga pacifica]
MHSIKTKRKKRTTTDRFSKPNRNSNNRNRNNGRAKKTSTIDPKSLIKKATVDTTKPYEAKSTFEELPIHYKLKQNLAKKGFSKPSQIQEETLVHLKDKRNLIGVANTGTGKTAAFLIPIIERLLENPNTLTALVVVPTRELALQVEQEFKSLAQGLKLFSGSFIGGTSIGKDLSQLKRKNHIIIGTPGRLKDLVDRKAIALHRIPVLVLDEFDRMLDMGFVHDIKRIVKSMDKREQTMLFSATIDKTQKNLISELISNPVEVKVNTGTSSSDRVEQDIIKVPANADKFEMLRDLISGEDFEKVIVFAETKRWVDRVTKKLNQAGIKSDLIHGNKSQNYRIKALDKFKKGSVKVLVATDVAARGIDVTGVTHVVNYQLPMTMDSYVHRIGRTGRAGKTGKAFTFVD